MWSRYHIETSNVRAFEMLVDLANIQPAISQYYATTHMVIEKQHVTTKPEQQQSITKNNSDKYEEENNYKV